MQGHEREADAALLRGQPSADLRSGDTLNQRRANILAELRRLDSELSHLTSAVASGGDLPVLLATLKER
ncbi:MAG: hypothetical protein DMF83_20975 [Acidobacteria bacterium]|nr:MAG: hypothetical protein DMF83_20975 [Acidobacteriota bacterium]